MKSSRRAYGRAGYSTGFSKSHEALNERTLGKDRRRESQGNNRQHRSKPADVEVP